MKSAAKVIVLAALLAFLPAAHAADFIERFDDLPVGTTFIDLAAELNTMGTERIDGGTVVRAGTGALADYPPVSGTKVYYGDVIDFYTLDPNDYSYEKVSAFVTGMDVVTATAYRYVLGLGTIPFQVMQTTGDNTAAGTFSPNQLLSFFTPGGGSAAIVRVEFRSTSAFTIDNLGYGGIQGVPEPATWLMLVAGFGTLGGALRRRRARVLAAA